MRVSNGVGVGGRYRKRHRKEIKLCSDHYYVQARYATRHPLFGLV